MMKPDMQQNVWKKKKSLSPARPEFLKYFTLALVEVLTYPVVNGKEKQFVMLKILPDIEWAVSLSPCVCSSS